MLKTKTVERYLIATGAKIFRVDLNKERNFIVSYEERTIGDTYKYFFYILESGSKIPYGVDFVNATQLNGETYLIFMEEVNA